MAQSLNQRMARANVVEYPVQHDFHPARMSGLDE